VIAVQVTTAVRPVAERQPSARWLAVGGDDEAREVHALHRAGAREVVRVGGRRDGGNEPQREGGEERRTQAHVISNE
jgi:hypothetical protein